jgi:hypothetical protein
MHLGNEKLIMHLDNEKLVDTDNFFLVLDLMHLDNEKLIMHLDNAPVYCLLTKLIMHLFTAYMEN